MPHTVSSVLTEAIYSESTERVFIELIEISHEDLDEPIRLTTDGAETVSNGMTFLPYPFDIVLPNDDDESQPSAALNISNVDQRVIAAIRTVTTPATFKIWVVLDDDPDRIERGPWVMELQDIRYNATNVSARIVVPSLLNEPFPSNTYNTVDYPAL